jgi:hypothetical protein
MGTRMVVALAALVAVVAVGGIGFATFTSHAFVSANVSSGTLDVDWAPTSGAQAPYADPTCPANLAIGTFTVSGSGDVMSFSIGNFEPNQECTVHAYILNAGSLWATLGGQIHCVGTSNACNWFQFVDSLPSNPSAGPLIPPAGVAGSIGCAVNGCYGDSFDISTGNSYGHWGQGWTVTFYETITAVATV